MSKPYIFHHRQHKLELKFRVSHTGFECPFHAPVVLIHTHKGESDFTRSPYWVQCPRLIKEIHQIESSGWIKILEDWINGPAKRLWDKFIIRVPKLLKSCLDADYAKSLEQENRLNIGGVINPYSIKCLHAHHSFWLVHKEGLVGQFVDGLLLLRARKKSLSDYWCQNSNELECGSGGSI